MACEALKLSVYLGERDHAGGRLLVDAVLDAYERHGVRTSILLRGIEGFGIKHRLQSERLLTLSEDLPLLAIALDTPQRIGGVLDEVRRVTRHGVLTLERAQLLDGDPAAVLDRSSDATVKLTIYLGRGERIGGRPADRAAIDCLRRHGLDGCAAFSGVDGTAGGHRRRARMVASNRQVPAMVISVGSAGGVQAALPELRGMLGSATMTLERVLVCKRDGVRLAALESGPAADEEGLEYWQKLMIYVSERSRHGRRQLYDELIRRLRREGAAGATAIRGHWGYHGAHAPHGERFWSMQRHVPVIVVVLDTPANMRRWYEIVDELTAESGLVTSELVPALRASTEALEHGGLQLAAPHGRA